MATSARVARRRILARRRPLPDIALSFITAAGLVVDGVVHLQLAADRDGIGGVLSEGLLFRVEAASAFAAALMVLALRRRRVAFAAALAVAGSAFAAVMLYRYVDVGALGPIPNMYEPIWYADKTWSAIAEIVAAVTSAAGALLAHRRITPSRPRLQQRP